MGFEQRRQKRLRLELPVRITLLDREEEAELVARLYDLSAGGCAVHIDHEIAIGTRVQVRITLDEHLTERFGKPELTARGAVCRLERHMDQFLVSIRFFK
jgi:c-di-GMP-binding flagellar brake protein YcgR